MSREAFDGGRVPGTLSATADPNYSMGVSTGARDISSQPDESPEHTSLNPPGQSDASPSCGGYGLLIFAVLSYSVVSLTVVYFNWWLFTSGFKFPVFVSWIQQCVGCGIFLVGSQAALYFSTLRTIFPAPSFSLKTARKVLPLSASFVLTVGLSNICLQKTLISTYQVARSLTLLFVIVLSYLLLKEKQSLPVLLACSLMVVGFVVGSLDPTTLSLGGLVAGGFSSFFQSLYNVLIKSTMPHVGGDNQMLLFYNVVLSSFLFIPMQLVSEDTLSWRQAFGVDHSANLWIVWGGMFLSGLLGTTLNMTQYLVVKVTSPLTFNIVGFTKSLFQSLGGILIFGDSVTVESAAGLLLCMVGSGAYAKAKNDASKQARLLASADEAEVKTPLAIIDVDKAYEEEDAQQPVSHSGSTVASPPSAELLIVEESERKELTAV